MEGKSRSNKTTVVTESVSGTIFGHEYFIDPGQAAWASHGMKWLKVESILLTS